LDCGVLQYSFNKLKEDLMMKNKFQISFKRLVSVIIPLCSLIISCNTSTQQPPDTSTQQPPDTSTQQPPDTSTQQPPDTSTTLAEQKISDSDITGWSTSAANADTFCVYPIDSFYCCAPGSADGGATPYDSAGCKEVAYQTLTGPSEMIFSSHSMDFLTAGKADSMFTLMKSWKSPVISINGFDTSTAFATKALQSLTVYAHFNKYYLEFYILGVTDEAAGFDAATKFLNVYKNRIK
jgi:hypothetical protein